MYDYWLALFIFTPCVVAYWRGTWQLLDRYMWPQFEDCLNSFTSFILGVGTITVLTMAQTPFTNYITSDKLGKKTFFIISRIYTVIFAFVGVNQWRGVWYLMDCQLGVYWWTAGSGVIIAAGSLAFLRTLQSVIAPPFSISVDDEVDYFKVQTIFKTQAKHFNLYYVMDVLFTVTIVGSLVVVVWWGVWTLFDIFLFPESKLWSAVTCVSAGFFVAFVCYLSQSSAAYCSRQVSLWPRMIFEDIYLFFAEVGAISLWRGIWYLLDIFFIPDDPYLSNTVTSTMGIGMLILLHSSNSILVKGVLYNRHSKDGSGCRFQVQYIRKIKKVFTFCYAVKPNDEKSHDATKKSCHIKNFTVNEKEDITIDAEIEPWLQHTSLHVLNGKLPNLVIVDRETVL